MRIENLPAIQDGGQRQFIRFAVRRIPSPQRPGSFYYGRDLQWHFRIDMKVDGKQNWFEWFQPSQEEEPEPDARLFFAAVTAMLRKAEESSARKAEVAYYLKNGKVLCKNHDTQQPCPTCETKMALQNGEDGDAWRERHPKI